MMRTEYLWLEKSRQSEDMAGRCVQDRGLRGRKLWAASRWYSFEATEGIRILVSWHPKCLATAWVDFLEESGFLSSRFSPWPIKHVISLKSKPCLELLTILLL